MSNATFRQQQQQSQSPIYDLKIYNQITPTLLISLSLLYVIVILIRYISWIYRKRKLRRMWLDRQKLERFFWQKQQARAYLEEGHQELRKPAQSYHSNTSGGGLYDEKSIKMLKFDSVATLVVVQEGHHCIIPPQQEENGEEEAIIGTSSSAYHHHLKKPPSRTNIDGDRTAGRSSEKWEKKHELLDTLANKIIHGGNHKRNNKRRQQLLWQWSVAMGYCRYNHGYQLETLKNRLLQQQQ